MKNDSATILQKAVDILETSGQTILDYYQGTFDVQFKGRFDMVTEADLTAEKQICRDLKKIDPSIPILAEESSGDLSLEPFSTDPDSSRQLWVLDPLDGTTNFAHGFPHFAISLALYENSQPYLAIIHDPVKQETFTAIKGKGARLNGSDLRVSHQNHLEQSLVATGFPYKVRELKENNLKEFCAFRLQCQGVRRFGSAALDLAYVAAGRLDGFWERWLKPWDTAAGILMVQEAGGLVSRFDGSPYSIFDSDLLTSNGLVHREMQEILTAPLPNLPKTTMIS